MKYREAVVRQGLQLALLRFLTTRHPPFSPKAAEDVLHLFRELAALAGLRDWATAKTSRSPSRKMN